MTIRGISAFLLLALPAASFSTEFLEKIDAPEYEAAGTAAELLAKGRICLTRIAGGEGLQEDAARNTLSAPCRADYTSLLVAYEARSLLVFTAKDGRFQLRHDGVENREREKGRDAPFVKVGKWFGSGWKDVQKALLSKSEKVAQCVRAGGKIAEPAKEALVPAKAPAPATKDYFARLKALAGAWEISDESGRREDVFELAARSDKGPEGATALVEKNAGYVAVYHLDGDSIMATLFADDGNQPRLRAKSGTLTFEFVDATNLKPGQGYMSALTFELDGPDRVVETWTYTENGKATPYRFALIRKKK